MRLKRANEGLTEDITRELTAKAHLQEDKLKLENEVLNLKIFNQKIHLEKQTLQKEHQTLKDKYTALRLAAEENALIDETELETHRQYFQTIMNNTKEVQAKVQAQKSQTAFIAN